MPSYLLTALLAVALLAINLSVALIGPGIRAWDRADQVNWAVLQVAVWPWLIYSAFDEPPRWWTIAAFSLFVGSLVVFIYRQAKFLRNMRRALNQMQTELAEARFDSSED